MVYTKFSEDQMKYVQKEDGKIPGIHRTVVILVTSVLYGHCEAL